jgi:hypothetical protein
MAPLATAKTHSSVRPPQCQLLPANAWTSAKQNSSRRLAAHDVWRYRRRRRPRTGSCHRDAHVRRVLAVRMSCRRAQEHRSAAPRSAAPSRTGHVVIPRGRKSNEVPWPWPEVKTRSCQSDKSGPDVDHFDGPVVQRRGPAAIDRVYNIAQAAQRPSFLRDSTSANAAVAARVPSVDIGAASILQRPIRHAGGNGRVISK